jgi:hypothetical protein
MSRDAVKSGSQLKGMLLLVLLVLCSYWIFIDTYRINAFNIVPHDDYAPYLLYIVGEDGGKMPGSPFAYRALSVAVAVPFYYVVPVYKFSLLEDIDTEYLRAIGALAMVSYLSILISCVLIFLIVTRQFRGSASAGLVGALGTVLLMQFSGYKGVDPVAIMLICLLIYNSRNLAVFAVLILLSAGFNEKISLVFSIAMTARYIFAREQRVLPYAALSITAFGICLLARVVIEIPGNEHQMQVQSFISNALANIGNLVSLKRFILEIVPVTTISILCVLAVKEHRENTAVYGMYFSVTDVSVLIGYVLVMLAVGVRYNTGRLVMFCAPFYIPLAAIHIERLARGLRPASSLP